MNTSDGMKRRRIVLAAIIAGSFVFIQPSSAAISPKRSVIVTWQNAHRPANLYRAVFQSDRSICGPIVASLNKPLDLPNDFDHPNLTRDLLLGSDLQVPWQRKLVGISGSLDYAQIDLANDGNSVAVYRYGYAYSEIRPEDHLYVLAKPADLWNTLVHHSADSDDILKESHLIPELAKQSLVALDDFHHEPSSSIMNLLAYRDVSLNGGGFNVNVLSVNGYSVLILTGPNESFGGLHGRPFHVFALLYHANSVPSLVCEFRTGA